MDRREAIAASYYTQRGVPGADPLLRGSQGLSYQNSHGVGTVDSELPGEASSAISPNTVNVGMSTVLPVGPAEPVKRRRGRPRKYGPDGSVSLALSSTSISPPTSAAGSMHRRGIGRPPGSGRKQHSISTGSSQNAMAGVGFTPHVITIAVGEDVAMKIMSFSQQCLKAVCVLSATGSVSTVTLSQSSSSGGMVTYKGRFEILCLSGSLLLMDNGGSRNRIGGLSISLASPDGRVIGGGIGGVLIAATPVQVIAGSFLWGNSKLKNERQEATAATDSGGRAMQSSAPTSIPASQKLSAVPFGMWSNDSQPVDIDDVQNIDLMRG
ncbi:hypothetical protein MLD38_019766 [Melastoma candidum]|uniref:Uncharacterized protein n=1 Tax=Melastoma candidum TaxID=119954 RepID=A0ACB9QY08_9MYRT|nr:hypothetical protein MLD38_019766 [Melastoma candidum]